MLLHPVHACWRWCGRLTELARSLVLEGEALAAAAAARVASASTAGTSASTAAAARGTTLRALVRAVALLAALEAARAARGASAASAGTTTATAAAAAAGAVLLSTAAGQASDGLVVESLLLVEGLLGHGEGELGAAVLARAGDVTLRSGLLRARLLVGGLQGLHEQQTRSSKGKRVSLALAASATGSRHWQPSARRTALH